MNEFCIPIRVENEESLYDRFYPSGLSFSGELVAYLEDYLKKGDKNELLHAERRRKALL